MAKYSVKNVWPHYFLWYLKVGPLANKYVIDLFLAEYVSHGDLDERKADKCVVYVRYAIFS